jgi:hypothetical protein
MLVESAYGAVQHLKLHAHRVYTEISFFRYWAFTVPLAVFSIVSSGGEFQIFSLPPRPPFAGLLQ